MARPCCCPPPEINVEGLEVDVDFSAFNDYEIEVLCDFNEGVPTPFIRVYRVLQDDSVSVVANRTLAGAAYVPTGTVGVCTSEASEVVEQNVDFGTEADFAGAPDPVSSYMIRYISGSVVVDGITLGGSILGTSAAADSGKTIPKPTITGGGSYEWRTIV